ncbi:hypothetical protein ACNEL7_005500, partial [Escherichia coli]
SHFSAYLILWFPLLIWWTPLCLIRQILTRRFRLYAYSHQERNGVRAAYIHKAEHLEERRLMLQWWADFLDANRERFISPFEYAKINNPLKQ